MAIEVRTVFDQSTDLFDDWSAQIVKSLILFIDLTY